MGRGRRVAPEVWVCPKLAKQPPLVKGLVQSPLMHSEADRYATAQSALDWHTSVASVVAGVEKTATQVKARTSTQGCGRLLLRCRFGIANRCWSKGFGLDRDGPSGSQTSCRMMAFGVQRKTSCLCRTSWAYVKPMKINRVCHIPFWGFSIQ